MKTPHISHVIWKNILCIQISLRILSNSVKFLYRFPLIQSRESHSVDALRAYSDDVSVLTQQGESSGLCSYCESKHL